MLDQYWLRFVVALCFLSAHGDLQAGFPVVGRTSGTLAVQTAPNADWRVLSAGNILPFVGEARTAATGPAHLQSDHGALSLGSLSRLQFDLSGRRGTLLAGRVFCAPAGKEAWIFHAGKSLVTVPAECQAEISITDVGTLSVTALKGQAEISASESAPIIVMERTVCTLSGAPTKADVKPLETAAEQYLTAWTRQLPPGQGVGQLVIKDAHEGKGGRLNIARYHAEVVLQPPIALVKIDQSFYNPSSRQEEGEFVFNLPAGASVSRFAMFVTKDQLIEGEVIERRRADEIYTSIVRSKRDPAILEQIGDDLFKMRVFPIFSKDTKRILLDFTLPLDGHDEQYQMQLPLLSNLLPIWDFRLFGTIRGPTPLASAQCPTIPGVKFESRRPNEITFDFVRSNYQPESDLVVSFQQQVPQLATTFRQLRTEPLSSPNQSLSADGSVIGAWAPWNGQSGVYFEADLPLSVAAKVAPADVLLLLDTSGNGSLDEVRPALQTVLAALRPEDRFRLLCVDVIALPLHEGWLQTGTPIALAAYQKFEQQICLGATDMTATCSAAAKEFAGHDPARRPVAIYIGHGLHRFGENRWPAVVSQCSEVLSKAAAPIFAINIQPPAPPKQREKWALRMGSGQGFFQFPNGFQPLPITADEWPSADGRMFLSELTKAVGGRSFDFSDAVGDRGRLFEWLLSGVPTPTRIEELAIEGCEAVDVYHPANLLPGEPFRVVGRKLGLVDRLKLTYRIAGSDGPIRVELTPNENQFDHLVGRYWAVQRLRHLQQMRAAPLKAGGNPAADNVIVALSREWSLLTPQTAFLVLESETDYQTWQVPRQARRRYWDERDVPKVEPLPADWLAKIQIPKSRSDIRNSKVTGEPELDRQLEAASAALKEKNYLLATQILDGLRNNSIATASDQYRNLRRTLSNLSTASLDILGLKQAWFDLDQFRIALPSATDRLILNLGTLTAELLDRHPFAEQLFREIDLPVAEMSVLEFATFLKTTVGVNVFVDAVKLEEENIAPEQNFQLPPLKRISVMNAVSHVLGQRNLTLVEERGRLKITTKTEGIEHRPRVLFPVKDLISKDPQFHFDDLQDPIFDRNQQVRQRIETKLKKVVSLHLKNASIDELVTRLRQELNENILVDKWKLEEESIATDATDIDCDYDQVPLGAVLTWVLDTKNLTYSIDRETLRLTTKTEDFGRRYARVYPADGLISRDLHALPAQRGIWNGWGMGGGMSGGMGGGMGGLGGSMGGGFDGEVTAGNSIPMLPDAVSNDAESTGDLPVDSESRANSDSPDVNNGFGSPFDEGVNSILMGLQQQTGGGPDAPWMEIDGEGGDLGFFFPSLSFVIRQTREAHRDIDDYFRRQRVLQAKRGTNPNMVPMTPRDALARNELDIGPLMMLIQQTTGGPPDSPWMESNGEGGAITYDRPRMAISIRQTPETLDQVNGLLVQLRRARYAFLHQTRPWERATFLGQQPGLLDGAWLARTIDTEESVGPVKESELAALQVRRALGSGRWKLTPAGDQTPATEFTMRHAADRMQLNWPGFEVELQGNEGSVFAPDLRYAELGKWGNGVRDWLDVELAFWPHRSNQELAQLYDVTAVPPAKQDTPSQVRLQFTLPQAKQQPVWIQVVYDTATGLPVSWESFANSVLVQWYRFQPEVTDGKLLRMIVRQEAADGHLLATGEWIPVAAEMSFEGDPTVFAPEILTIDRRTATRATLSPFESGWQFMRKGEYALAEAEYRKVLAQYPEHPLAQFLFALSLNRQLGDVPQERLQAAYAAVIQTGSSELVQSLLQLDSAYFSPQKLYELLQTRPLAMRDLRDEMTLAQLSLKLDDKHAALEHAQAAWKQHPAAGAQALQVAKLVIQSQLLSGHLDQALAHYEICRADQQFAMMDLIALLETFESHNRGSDVAKFYQELLNRKDATITVETRRKLLKNYANATVGIERWQALLAAIDLLPELSVDAASDLKLLRDELNYKRDFGAAEELAKLTKFATHRQQLKLTEANLRPDVATAQKIYWQLHQEGYLFREDLQFVTERLIEAQHPEQAAAILETLIRKKIRLTQSEKRQLADAYRLSNQPLEEQRVLSDL